MKFHFCQNDFNEITPAINFISGCFLQTVIRDRPDTKLKIFHFARNEISCKHLLTEKLTTLKLFLVENKDKTKTEIRCLLFRETK